MSCQKHINTVEYCGGYVKAEAGFSLQTASYWIWKRSEEKQARQAAFHKQERGEERKQKCRDCGYTEQFLLVFNFSNQAICVTSNITRTQARCLQICVDLHMFSDI